MNKAPIGIFDSGIGGLSVLQEIRTLMPSEDLIYIADSAFAPYGNKPQAFIQQRAHALSRFLLEQNTKAIVVACNTATAAAVESLRRQFTVPIIAMEPGVKPAIAATKTGIVGVLATENTLTSRQFTKLLHRYAADVKVISQPCPGLVEQIEAGEFGTDKTYQLIRQFTAPLLSAGADTIVLGCTHYPLIRQQITEVLGKAISIIETGQAVAQQLQRILLEDNMIQSRSEDGTISCWTSAEPRHLQHLSSLILQEPIPTRQLPTSVDHTYI